MHFLLLLLLPCIFSLSPNLKLNCFQEITIKGHGNFKSLETIRQLLFLPKESGINSKNYRKTTEIPSVQIVFECQNASELIWKFDSIAVLAAFNYFGLDINLENGHKFVTGAVYGFSEESGRISTGLSFPLMGTLSAVPKMISKNSLTVEVSFDFGSSQQIISCQFVMVYKATEAAASASKPINLTEQLSNFPLKQGSKFQELRNEIASKKQMQSEAESLVEIKCEVSNIYDTVFGGYLMSLAFEKAGHQNILLKSGIFLRPIPPGLNVFVRTRRFGNEILVEFQDSEVDYCQFLFLILGEK